VDHGGDHAVLVVRRHHQSKEDDDEAWHGIQTGAVLLRLCPLLFLSLDWTDVSSALLLLDQDIGVEKVASSLTFDEHTEQTATEEHDGDGDVLKVGCFPSLTPAAEVFQEDIGCTVEEEKEALHKFARRHFRREPGHERIVWSDIPGPAKIAKGTHPATKSEKAVPEKDGTLDPVRKTVEDARRVKDAPPGDEASANSEETKDDLKAFEDNVDNLDGGQSGTSGQMRYPVRKKALDSAVADEAVVLRVVVVFVFIMMVVRWLERSLRLLRNGVGTIVTRWRAKCRAASFGTLTRVTREAIVFSQAVVVELVVLCQVFRSDRMVRSRDTLAGVEETDEAEEYPYYCDPSDSPSDPVMRVVRVQIRCVCVVDDACEDAKAIYNEKGELDRDGQPRPSGANHDGCERSSIFIIPAMAFEKRRWTC